MKLTPEQLQRLEDAQLANVLKKLQSGKTLTRREQEILDRQKNADAPNYVQTWGEVADQLGCSRRHLQNVRAKFKKAKDLPRDRDDGRKDVTAWRKFFVDHALWEAADAVDGEPTKADWDRKRSQIDYETALYRLEIERQKHVQLDEILAAVGQMLAGFRTAVNMLPGSAARWLIGLKDFHSIKARLESEVDGVLQSLGRCEYLGQVAAPAVEQLFPNESADFKAKLVKAIEQSFIEIGRRSLTDLMQKDFTECPPPA